MLSILTGMLRPTSGDAKICGLELSKKMNEIRKIMGVVHQFDILWQDMTGIEHMKLFCQIKGVKHMNSVIKEKL